MLKKYSSLLFAFSFSIGLSAQENPCPTPSKKAAKLFEKAQFSPTREKKELLFKALEIDPNYIEAIEGLADIAARKEKNSFDPLGIIQSGNQKRNYWQKMVDICPEYRNFYYTAQLGDYYFSKRDFDLSKPYYEKVVAAPKPYKDDLSWAKDRLKDIETYNALVKDTVPFSPQKLKGPSSSQDEYLPMLSPDNKYLYFTRKMADESKGAADQGFSEKFIRSRSMGSNYSGGIPMPSPFNKGQYQGGVSISVNNKLLFITIVDVIPYRGKERAGYGRMFDNADIYYSELKDGKWTTLKSIGNNINTPTTWEAQPSISADNKTLYFTRVVNPFGGDMDIYKSEKQADGSWGNPVNLGEPINTPGDEKSPFMHSDSYTLYFSSNYHIGMGGYDIFYAQMDGNTKNFKSPTNIGNPINTPKDEHGFIVSKDGKKAYYGSDDEGKNLNIYHFDLYEEARPKSVAFVNGSIQNSLGKVPEGAKITLKNTVTNQEVEAVIDEKTGDYVAVIAVEKDQDVMLTAKKKGFAFNSQLIASDEIATGKPIESKQVEIKPIEVGSSYQINDINFATNSYEITPRITKVLDEFIDFLTLNDNLKIAINGYTDNVGNSKENLVLSENRAEAVFNYLVQYKIETARLTFKGYGDQNPIASNKNEAGRRKNRRTEFVILSE